MHAPILAPVVALVAWSLVMLVWLMIVRAPAMKRAGLDLKSFTGGRPGGLDGVVEEKAQWPAHNYIHLMEQPTLFYAVCLALAFMGQGSGVNAWFAWAYVGLRVAHSLVQATFNRVIVRFTLFTLASLVLLLLTAQAVRALYLQGLL